MIPHELISQSITEWITGLNYQYIAVTMIICYGLKYKPSVQWLEPKLGGHEKAKWVIGLLVGFTEIISTFPFLGGDGGDLTTFILLIHSYLIAMIFCDDITTKIHDWAEFLSKKKPEDE